jgi:hypothetical protein
MARFRCGFAFAGVLAIVLAACSSSDSNDLNVDKAKSEIQKLADGAYSEEAKVDNVRCPKTVPIEKGLTFFCTVDIDGVPLRVRLRQKDAKGNVRIDQAEAVVFTKKLENFVSSYAAEHDEPTTKVACGKRTVLTGAPGQVLTCTVTFADGKSGVAKVVVNDTAGKVGLTSIKATS